MILSVKSPLCQPQSNSLFCLSPYHCWLASAYRQHNENGTKRITALEFTFAENLLKQCLQPYRNSGTHYSIGLNMTSFLLDYARMSKVVPSIEKEIFSDVGVGNGTSKILAFANFSSDLKILTAFAMSLVYVAYISV